MSAPEAEEPQAAQERTTGETGLWSRRGVRLGAYLMAGLLSVGAGLGVTSSVRSSAASQIPSPPAKNQSFVVDDNGVGQDNQTNADWRALS
jgi:hypothetical protein